MSRSLIEYAVIQQKIDGHPFDAIQAPCRININGQSPNAEVRAVVWSSDPVEIVRNSAGVESERAREPGFIDVDRLTSAEVIDTGGKLITIRGISDKLQAENRLKPEDAWIEWSVELRGCQDCS